GTLSVASVEGFPNDGTITVAGLTGDCLYTGRNATTNQFTGVSGCTGSALSGAVAKKDVVENGSDTGLRHAGLDLEYHANVNIHGDSRLIATGNVTLSSSVDVTATATAGAGPDE